MKRKEAGHEHERQRGDRRGDGRDRRRGEVERAARARARSRRRSTRPRSASRSCPRASAGLLGVGVRPARVLASVSENAAAFEPRASARPTSRRRPPACGCCSSTSPPRSGIRCRIEVAETDDSLHATCSGGDLGLLIGKHGQTIDAVQTLANAMLAGGRSGRTWSSTRRATASAVSARSRESPSRAAEEALRSHGRVELEPMTAGRAEARARVPEGVRRGEDGERRGRAESVRRRSLA